MIVRRAPIGYSISAADTLLDQVSARLVADRAERSRLLAEASAHLQLLREMVQSNELDLHEELEACRDLRARVDAALNRNHERLEAVRSACEQEEAELNAMLAQREAELQRLRTLSNDIRGQITGQVTRWAQELATVKLPRRQQASAVEGGQVRPGAPSEDRMDQYPASEAR